MPKKYIKDKDGKFKGSIPSAPNLPSPLNSPLPSLPISLVKDTAQTLSVNKAEFGRFRELLSYGSHVRQPISLPRARR